MFYQKWKKYNEIQLTKNKINLNIRKMTNHPPSPGNMVRVTAPHGRSNVGLGRVEDARPSVCRKAYVWKVSSKCERSSKMYSWLSRFGKGIWYDRSAWYMADRHGIWQIGMVYGRSAWYMADRHGIWQIGMVYGRSAWYMADAKSEWSWMKKMKFLCW